ncbi:major capsid family protein [Actinobacillus seminis]|uniref:major capsid family protein n=1 Tax=Actinobacillus seminis TaxID=722 RepID=UPI003B964F7D
MNSKRYISGRTFAARLADNKPVIAMDMGDVASFRDLEQIGIGFTNKYLKEAQVAYAMDDVQGGIYTHNGGAPVQFLQTFLPGFVKAVTAPRKIDEIVGMQTIGEWHDEEVVQPVLETLGDAVPYADLTPVPLSGWNAAFERRTVVRFEKGIKVGTLESARAAAMRLDSANAKRTAASTALNIQRNLVGFRGYNDGNSRTYGFLNDPSLLPYQTVAEGASGETQWAKKAFLEITADLRNAFSQLELQSNGVVDAKNTPTVLVLPTGGSNYLSVISDMGVSVAQWLSESYPKCRTVTAPQLQKANGGADVFYLFAEEVYGDDSDDDNRVFIQVVPASFIALGVENRSKGVIEDYTNATAGVMCKRPYAVFRGTGI